jgi:hypothetical protein
MYNQGTLTIIWKYKNFQKELIHEKSFFNMHYLAYSNKKKLREVLFQK